MSLCLIAGPLQAQVSTNASHQNESTRVESEPQDTRQDSHQLTAHGENQQAVDPRSNEDSDPIPTQTLGGRVRLVNDQGQPITADVDLSEAVVYFDPEVPGELVPSDDEFLLTTARRSFVPRVLVIETGTEVRFPNSDPILHNVFSSSPGNRFDLGLYGRSDGETHTFNTAGLVRVFCNVHPGMSAHIVVVNTPYHLRPDNDGRFVFDALPLGSGTLTAWHERSDPVQLTVTIGAEAIELEPIDLRATVRQIAPQRERLRRRRRRY
ncbi:MAG: hypothetical protein AAGJ52_12520 [Pseudomonadota bacterium]